MSRVKDGFRWRDLARPVDRVAELDGGDGTTNAPPHVEHVAAVATYSGVAEKCCPQWGHSNLNVMVCG